MNKSKKSTNFFKIIMLFICIVILFVGSFLCFFSVMYPVKYKNFIYASCQEFQVDYLLTFSIINAESGFVPDKVSTKGAIGLMQLMPSTAIYVADQLGYENFQVEILYNPEVNIKFGVYYLSYLSKKFETIEQVICAYNAGETAVRGWLKNKEYSNDGVKLDIVPYQETSNYLKKVQKNMKIYEKII